MYVCIIIIQMKLSTIPLTNDICKPMESIIQPLQIISLL